MSNIGKLFSKIPGGVAALLGVIILLMPVMFLMPSRFLKYFFLAYIILGVIAAAAMVLHLRKQKKQSQQFDQDVREEAGKSANLKDPDRIAEEDSLRREFQRGIDIYKAYGKDLYSLPWYVVVGEPGAGKTEAIRNSEIGFPDKLQDRQQGTGGTYSMHWWFTNYAVILDTAGRLFFEQTDDGEKSAWVSFLKMLRKNRGDCPINGLLLVLPVTTLTAEYSDETEAQAMQELEHKAGQIAHQLETIQKQLTVRFPVYIVITKTDKIPGFREFFEDVKDAKSRYQMLGWSNPAPLDAAFDPRGVDAYISEIAGRLRKRRMVMIKDPTPRNQEVERLDEVDALYALPDSFEALAPKLRRYLEHIFLRDQWSAKPPYLRGIYFTSAMQEGAVLDRCIAEAMGIRLDDLEDQASDEGGWKRNRAYFLRDLFVEKIFKERGLVMPTGSSGKKSGRVWKIAGAVAAVCLVGLVTLGFFSRKDAREELAHWETAVQSMGQEKTEGATGKYVFSVIEEDREEGGNTWRYRGEAKTRNERDGTESKSRVEWLAGLDTITSKGAAFGWIYKPAQLLDQLFMADLKKDRRRAFLNCVKLSILLPLCDAAMPRMKAIVSGNELVESGFEKRRVEEALLALAALQIDMEAGPSPELNELDYHKMLGDETLAPLLRFTTTNFTGKGREQGQQLDTMAELIAALLAEWRDYDGFQIQPMTGDDREALTAAVGSVLEKSVLSDTDLDGILKQLRAFDKAASSATDTPSATLAKLMAIAAELEKLPLDRYAGMKADADSGDAPEDATDESEDDASFAGVLRKLVDGRTGKSPFAEGIEALLSGEAEEEADWNEIDREDKKLLDHYLASDETGGSQILRYRRFLDILQACADPLAAARLDVANMRTPKDVETLEKLHAEAKAAIAGLAEADGDKFKELGDQLLEEWTEGLGEIFIEGYLFFPLVRDSAQNYDLDTSKPLDVTLAFLAFIEGNLVDNAAFASLREVADGIFPEGKPVGWILSLPGSQSISYAQMIRLSSYYGWGGYRDISPRRSGQKVEINVEDDIKIELILTAFETDPITFGKFYNEQYGLLMLVLSDGVEVTRSAGNRQIEVTLPVVLPKTTRQFYFTIRLTSETTIPDPKTWPTRAGIEKKMKTPR